MTLDEQILRTQEEHDAYAASKFSAPELVEWLAAVLESLHRLKGLEK